MNGQAIEIMPLDDAAIETIADLNSQIRACEFAKNSVLNYFGRQHNLVGPWRLAPNNKELVKDAPVIESVEEGKGNNA